MEVKGIGMIGVGNMASAIAKAIVKAVPEETLYLANRTANKIESLVEELQAKQVLMESVASDMLQHCNMIFIGVKPKDITDLFTSFADSLDTSHSITWISMASNVSLAELARLTPEHHRWIRIMPNTPVEVGEGFTSYCFDAPNFSETILERFTKLMSASGTLSQVPESLFDTASGLAGCSPAFIFQLIEAMSDAGVAYGLGRDQSIQMAAQAVKGAAAMVLETERHPAQLKDAVTSPGGTTIAGVTTLEAEGFRSAIIKGISAAIEKTRELQQ